MSQTDAIGAAGDAGRTGATVDDGASRRDQSPSGQRVLVAETARIMATEISVQIAAVPEQEAAASAAARACMSFFAEIDAHLSRFKPESELSRANRAAGRWFAASDLLFACLDEAIAAAHTTGGLFDPTLLHPIEELGYDRDFAEIARREAPPRLTSAPTAQPTRIAGGWRLIELDRRRRRVRLPAGSGIDLGGIAKGWAADVAFERFCAAFPGALINLGGDLRLHGGPQPGQAWTVGIRDPRDELLPGEPRYVVVIAFSRGGLATSGALSRWWLRDGQRQHHLLDPRTGRPIRLWIDGDDAAGAVPNESSPDEDGARLIATATALAPTATQAEVAAKVALLRGQREALRGVERGWGAPFAQGFSNLGDLAPSSSADANVALLLAFGDGEVVMSRNMRDYLASWATEGAPVSLRVAGSTDRAWPAQTGRITQ